MCDKETKKNFFWSHIAEGVLIIIGAAILFSVWKMHEHIQWSEEFHSDITPAFFYQKRYGLLEEMVQRDKDAEQRKILGLKIEALHKELQITTANSQSHIAESEVWKDMIRDLANSVRRLQEMVWKSHSGQLRE